MSKYGEPWATGKKNTRRIFDPKGMMIAGASIKKGGPCGERTFEEAQANAARIVACVNALQGLSPEGVRGLVEVVEDMLQAIKNGLIDSKEIGHFGHVQPFKWHTEWEHLARAALTKIKGDEDAPNVK